MWILRKLLHPMDELAAMEFLLDKMKTPRPTTSSSSSMKRARSSGGSASRVGTCSDVTNSWIARAQPLAEPGHAAFAHGQPMPCRLGHNRARRYACTDPDRSRSP
jgi:hypothetical protein